MLLNSTTPADTAIASPFNDAQAVKAKPVKKTAAKKKAKPAAKSKKTAVPKKPAVKNAAPKKAAAKKAAAKKVVAPKVAKAIVIKPAAATTAKKKAKTAKAPNSAIFLEKDTYKVLIAGLMDQGIEHGDAVHTLKVGLRQANGIPVPMTLMMSAG